jgi:D-alanyl-lipoteichoic acid acyltransferase DltB (MBOAT superfamily)
VEFVALPYPYFFLVVLTLAWTLRTRRNARNLVLVLASAWFAWKWQPLFLFCLFGSSLFNYLAGELLARPLSPFFARAPEGALRRLRGVIASVAELWVVMFAYTAQIYLDFSGYTDIARGCARLLGFELPENFRFPYAASDLTDYWRRWHMSFSRWLREYVYFPLGGSRHGTLRTSLNLLVTFVACGLWHGPRWGFVIWGALHGFGLIGHKLIRDRRRALGREVAPTRGPVGWLLGWSATLSFCAFGLSLRLSCGESDRWLAANRAFHASADALHIAHAYDEAPYGHDWAYWQRIVPEHVTWHADRLLGTNK